MFYDVLWCGVGRGSCSNSLASTAGGYPIRKGSHKDHDATGGL